MGIPAAFRWLSNKYPRIISPVIEDKPITMDDGTEIPVDCTQPNPNGEEFDNLYLDMNGIVHPCTHPEDRPAPENEEEMMLEVFRYTDRVVNMVRPRKLLMIAVGMFISVFHPSSPPPDRPCPLYRLVLSTLTFSNLDGVAPRAKMNQQRSRRFRAAQEAKENELKKQEFMIQFKKEFNGELPPHTAEAAVKKAFDSNSITPGTPFMDVLATSLRYWCAYKLNTDPAWSPIKVIISDASVPGEGEHKIMEFVRSQRSSPDHDPNTRHVIYGLDADLIMLGLATHEPNFRVLREDVFFQQGKTNGCRICGQEGHEARNCMGEAKKIEVQGEKKKHPLKPFIWLHVNILREYLQAELSVPNLPFRWDLERAIDDWVFLCFFVGNDFLPHLPALEIREDGIDTLTTIWRNKLPSMNGFMTKDGDVNLERAQVILEGLGKQEDAIFRRRKEQEERREANAKRRKLQQQDDRSRNWVTPSDKDQMPKEHAPGNTHDIILSRNNDANKSAASVLRAQIQKLRGGQNPSEESTSGPNGSATPLALTLGKRKAFMVEGDSASTPGASEPGTPNSTSDSPKDTVRLWEEGYADRYYEQKFKADRNNIEFRRKVARAYVEGLAWVLRYYFQGCPSWEWFYPYHYAPFAQDFVGIGKMEIKFEKGRISRPFEQLMSVLPAASRHAIPEVFHDLMTNPDSEIIDFYPEDFELDLNGKKMVWQAVILLPFIDMPRLLDAVSKKYPLLTEAERIRNSVGHEVLLFSEKNKLYPSVVDNLFSKKAKGDEMALIPRISKGLSGTVAKPEDYIPHQSVQFPFDSGFMPDIDDDRSLMVWYEMPQTASHIHKSMLLRGAVLPKPVLTQADKFKLQEKSSRNGWNYRGAPLGRPSIGPDRDGKRGRGYGAGYGSYQNYGSQGSFLNNFDTFTPPPRSWLQPPPGPPGFGAGLPPPPPPPVHQYKNGPVASGGYGGYNSGTYNTGGGGGMHGSWRGYGGNRGGEYDRSYGGTARGPYSDSSPGRYGGPPAPPPPMRHQSNRHYNNRSDGNRQYDRNGGSGGHRGNRRGSGGYRDSRSYK